MFLESNIWIQSDNAIRCLSTANAHFNDFIGYPTRFDPSFSGINIYKTNFRNFKDQLNGLKKIDRPRCYSAAYHRV